MAVDMATYKRHQYQRQKKATQKHVKGNIRDCDKCLPCTFYKYLANLNLWKLL